ncbi:MAG: universal stress protein [Steroidobacteraceae bacterium]|jgi:nucleotide-binding universal stress UspA family protein
MYSRILVPVDGSEASLSALNEAVQLAKEQRGELRLLHIVKAPILEYGFSPADSSRQDIVAALSKIGKSILGKAETTVREQGLTPQCQLMESVAGSAAAVILDQARQWRANLIVMGSQPRGGPKAVGSDTAEVLSSSAVPVLLVRGIPAWAEKADERPTEHRDLNYASAFPGTAAV